MKYVYDIECYSNFFCVTFKDVDSKEIVYFEISKLKNELEDIYTFITQQKLWLLGYNNHYYDNQLLNYIYVKKDILSLGIYLSICNSLYDLSQKIIKDDYKEYKYRLPFKSIDLMRVGGIQQKSLKLVAVNLQWKKIQDLPIPFDAPIELDQIELIKKYNLNDVEITEQLYIKLLPAIKLRQDICKEYNVDVMDESDSGISNKLLEKFYCDETGLKFNQFKDLRTRRDMIHFGEVIFKNIRFETPELQKFLDKLRSFVLIKDKTYFKKSIIFRGLKLNLGVGGIHSDDRPGLFEETEDCYIIDADVGSMYPSLIINNNICPEHLDRKFLTRYKKLREERIEAKHNKQMTKSDALKLCLNSAYGKMNFEHHWLYDPLQAYKVTVNGQLYLMMLDEALILSGFEVISNNTDGVTTKVPKDKVDLYYSICKKWEQITGFELEYAYYKKYIRRDVNSYIAQYQNGKVKEKGAFVRDTPLQKGVDSIIIPIALQEFFLKGTPIRDTICTPNYTYKAIVDGKEVDKQTTVHDFCTSGKTDNKFSTEFHYLKDNNLQIDTLQKTNRYIISKKGGKLYKTYVLDHDVYDSDNWYSPDKPAPKLIKVKGDKSYIDFCVGRQVVLLNDYDENTPISEYNLDYGYYISEAQKIIDLIIPPQLTLW